MKKEIPILFSTPMVKSIDVDIKTQTRRTKGLEEFNENPNCWSFKYRGENLWSAKHKLSSVWELEFKCPYGQVGDLLYVRETFSRHFMWNGASLKEWSKTIGDGNTCFFYKDETILGGCSPSQRENRWWPSIHMPKAAARIWLEITNIKIERLNDISFADHYNDALAEGVERHSDGFWKNYEGEAVKYCVPQGSFRSLWCSINGKKSWEQNPFVWVITFKKVAKP